MTDIAVPEMVHRVAEALYATEHLMAKAGSLDEQTPDMKAYWYASARAAIEAMREPTLPMVRAAIASDPRRKRVPATIKRDWRAAIDSALSVTGVGR